MQYRYPCGIYIRLYIVMSYMALTGQSEIYAELPTNLHGVPVAGSMECLLHNHHNDS